MREYYRRKSQYASSLGAQVVVTPLSQRGEGSSGGIGEGMQYQLKPGSYVPSNDQALLEHGFEKSAGGQDILLQSKVQEMELLHPVDINEPIEGVLISEEENRIAPVL